VSQGGGFPIRYLGGEQPNAPRKSRICLVKQGGRLRLTINGQNVLRYEDPDPIPAPRVGLGGYHTRFNLSHIEIGNLPGD